MKTNELYNAIYSKKSTKVGLDVDYFIFVKDKCVYLGFRGSESVQDWIGNLDFPAKMYKHQENTFYVHRGFAKSYLSANDTVMEAFIKQCNKYPEYKPTIIGHSLGGAMAVLAAEDFYFRTKKKADVITFGCPRLLWGNNSKNYFFNCMNKIEQYEVRNDLVTKIPAGYTNVSSIYIGECYNWFKMMKNIVYYHTSYGLKELY